MRVFFALFLLAAVAAAGRPWGSFSGTLPVPEPWEGSRGDGADVLFLFLGYDDYDSSSIFVCGDLYWNPGNQTGGTGWALHSISPSWAEPEGSPYHWNGGLGSAMDALGYSWEWYPGSTGRCGQAIPDHTVLEEYPVLFVMTFDAYHSQALTSATRATLATYMQNGGKVVLTGQDVRYSGVPESWLDQWFHCGEIQQDVRTGSTPFPAMGMSSSFLIGWSGTALIENFSASTGGGTVGQWWADDLSGNGTIGDASWIYASTNDLQQNLFSTFHFEACSPDEVLSITERIMLWMFGTHLERLSWGGIKAAF